MSRVGHKRRLTESHAHVPAVRVWMEARTPPTYCSTFPASPGPRNVVSEPPAQRGDDVESLFTAAEVRAFREKDAKLLRAQLADEYEAKILQLKAKHAEAKAAAEKGHAEMLATALQQSQRHINEKAELHAEIKSLQEKLKAMHAADKAALSIKPEHIRAVDEQSVRERVEKEISGEKMKKEHELRSQIAEFISNNSSPPLVRAVEGYEAMSVVDDHHTACAQSLALVAYTSADNNADAPLGQNKGRHDVAAIHRFGTALLSADVATLERTLDEIESSIHDREVWRLLQHYETVLKRKWRLKASPLSSDCWSDVVQCLTHPIWHDWQTLCRKFDPVLASLLHHLHSDVHRATFKRVFGNAHLCWQITLQSKSGRVDKTVYYYGSVLGDSLLASAVMQDVEVHQPEITRDLLARLVEEHLSTANDLEFTMSVTCPSGSRSDLRRQSEVRRQTTAAFSQYRVDAATVRTYEIPSGSALLIVKFVYSIEDLDMMTLPRKRLTA